MSTFLERGLLGGVPAVLLLIIVTNPMKWEWPLQLGASLVVVGAGIMICYGVEHIRKKPTATSATAASVPLMSSNDDSPKTPPAHNGEKSEPGVHMEQRNSGNAIGNFQMYRPTINLGRPPRQLNDEAVNHVASILSTVAPKRLAISWANGSREAVALANSLGALFQRAGWELAGTGPWIAYPCEGQAADLIVVANSEPTQNELAVGQALTKLGLNILVCRSQGDAVADHLKLIVQGAE